MKLLFVFVLLVLCLGVKSQELCDSFDYENEDYGICTEGFSRSIIWDKNTTEVVSHVNSNFKIVSWTFVILTFRAVTAVRKDIGSACWDDSNLKIASFMLEKGDFENNVPCSVHPDSSPSIFWEGLFELDTIGYKNCADLSIMYEDILGGCERFHHDGVLWATIGYLFILYLIILILYSLCVSVL